MMFEVIYIKTFRGDEYKIIGNDRVMHLEWRYPGHDWDLLYFCKPDEMNMCFKKLAEEMEFKSPGKEFELDAYRKCMEFSAD